MKILPFWRDFISKFAAKRKVKPKKISPEAMAGLMNYEWPGKVRELENAIERALVLGNIERDPDRRPAGAGSGEGPRRPECQQRSTTPQSSN